eukprot:scaffold191252_cov18-Prasinocladus_malaysianus.AAC.1
MPANDIPEMGGERGIPEDASPRTARRWRAGVLRSHRAAGVLPPHRVYVGDTAASRSARTRPRRLTAAASVPRKWLDISLTISPRTAHDITDVVHQPLQAIERWLKEVVQSPKGAVGLERGFVENKLHLHAAASYYGPEKPATLSQEIKARVCEVLGVPVDDNSLSILARKCDGRGMGKLNCIAAYATKERFSSAPGVLSVHWGFTEEELRDGEVTMLKLGKGIAKNKVLLSPKDLFDKMGAFWAYRMDQNPGASFASVLTAMLSSGLYILSGEFATKRGSLNVLRAKCVWRVTMAAMHDDVTHTDAILSVCDHDSDLGLAEGLDWELVQDRCAEDWEYISRNVEGGSYHGTSNEYELHVGAANARRQEVRDLTSSLHGGLKHFREHASREAWTRATAALQQFMLGTARYDIDAGAAVADDEGGEDNSMQGGVPSSDGVGEDYSSESDSENGGVLEGSGDREAELRELFGDISSDEEEDNEQPNIPEHGMEAAEDSTSARKSFAAVVDDGDESQPRCRQNRALVLEDSDGDSEYS